MGIVIMFTTPTWPAVVDAFTRRDFAWIRNVTNRLWMLVGGYCAALIIALPLLGPTIFPLIYGSKFPTTWQLLLAFSLYVTTSSWGHTNNALLIGVGLVKRAAIFSLLETSILLIPAALGIYFFDLTGLFIGMAIAMLATTGWLFPMMLVNRIRTQSLNPAVI